MERPTSRQISILRCLISTSGIILIAVHLIWPHLKVDIITLGLALVVMLPWLSWLLKSAELPGGIKLEFHDLQAASEKVLEGTASEATRTLNESSRTNPSFTSIANTDPNLTVVGIRIEIEKRLRLLAEHYGLISNVGRPISAGRLLDLLENRQVFDSSTAGGLRELIIAGNQAAHGARVDADAIDWAIQYAPKVLAVLDAKITSSPNAV